MSQTKPRTKKAFTENREQLFVHVMTSCPCYRATIVRFRKGDGKLVVDHQKNIQLVNFMELPHGHSFWGMGKKSMVSWRGKDRDSFLRDWRPITRQRFEQFQADLRAAKQLPWKECWDKECQLRAELAAELLADDSLTA